MKYYIISGGKNLEIITSFDDLDEAREYITETGYCICYDEDAINAAIEAEDIAYELARHVKSINPKLPLDDNKFAIITKLAEAINED